MKNYLLSFLAAALLCAAPFSAHSFESNAFRFGVGSYAQNSMGKTTRSADASPAAIGLSSYPLFVKFDYLLTTSWYISPFLSYTPLARSSAGDAAETTTLQLWLPFGTDLYRYDQFVWDWQFGPGISVYNIKGKGGVETLSNGTSTAQFARPARSVNVQTVVFEIGTAVYYSNSRLGFDVVIEDLLSSTKRSQSFLFSYSYRFGGSSI